MNKINDLIGIVIESIYDCLRFYLLLIVCILNVSTKTMNNLFLPVGIVFIMVMGFIIPYLRSSKYGKVLFSVIIIAVGAICSVILYHGHIIGYFIGTLYFVLLGVYTMMKQRNGVYMPDEVRDLLIILAIAGLFSVFLSKSAYLDQVNNTATFYCLFAIVYMVRLNLINQYRQAQVSISSNFNIIFINALSIIIAVIFIILQRNVIEWLPYCFLYVALGVMRVLIFGWNILYSIYSWIMAFSMKNTTGGMTSPWDTTNNGEGLDEDYGSGIEEGFVNQSIKDLYEKSNITEYTPFAIGIACAIIAVIILFVVISFMRMKKEIETGIEEGEEKSFILTPKSLKEMLTKNLRKTFGNDVSEPTRRKYIKTVNGLIKKGYEMRIDYTPNEYARTIDVSADKTQSDIDHITEQYNVVRYREGK